ncbi:MAG: acylphosphatase [Methylococcaceae bacterium]|nr:MAG: acylphosphatase [Methylococcaceae bacterium]
MRKVHVWVSGRVQGVCYRATACEQAQSRSLTGWVKNLADGRVEIVAEGNANAVAAFLDWCRRGPSHARVDNLEVLDETASGGYSGFAVR